MKTSRKILVAGCGAIGSVFACLLAERGHRVTVLGRGAHLEAVAASGLRIEGIWGEHCAQVGRAERDPSRLGGGFDAALVTCKSFDTEKLVVALADRLATDGVAISLQNGLGNVERIAAAFGHRRVLAGRVIFGAERRRPGCVAVTVEAEPVLLGSPQGGPDRRADGWATLFEEAGIHCRASENVMAALWGKVFYNAALNPLGALLGLRYGELPRDPERRSTMDRIIEEAYAVAEAEGARLPWRNAAEYRRLFYERLVPSTEAHRSSMLQDLEAGRATEIDAITGEVVRRGEARGIDVSENRRLLEAVRERSA